MGLKQYVNMRRFWLSVAAPIRAGMTTMQVLAIKSMIGTRSPSLIILSAAMIAVLLDS